MSGYPTSTSDRSWFAGELARLKAEVQGANRRAMGAPQVPPAAGKTTVSLLTGWGGTGVAWARSGPLVIVSANVTRTGTTFSQAAWSVVPLTAALLPVPVGASNAAPAATNQTNDMSWQFGVDATGVLYLASRWQANTFTSGNFAEASFAYMTSLT